MTSCVDSRCDFLPEKTRENVKKTQGLEARSTFTRGDVSTISTLELGKRVWREGRLPCLLATVGKKMLDVECSNHTQLFFTNILECVSIC